jgi:carbamoyltransferase
VRLTWLGLGVGFHNAGAALVRISPQGTVELVCNEEEERYTASKHCSDYPERSIEAIKRHLEERGLGPEDLAACVSSWDFAKAVETFALRPLLEEFPATLTGLATQRPGDVFSETSSN